MRRLLCAVVAAVFLAAPLALADNPPGQQQAADAFAQATCAALQQSLGAKFSTFFSSLDDCRSKLSGTWLGCAASNKPGTDGFKACLQAVVPSPGGGGGGGGGGVAPPDPTQLASQVAKSLCSAMQKNLPDFASKYGSYDACVAKLTDDAAKLVASCLAAGKVGTDAFNKCMADGIKALAPAPPTQGPPPSAGAQAAAVAKSICTAIQKQSAASFASKYGSLDACVAKFTGIAASVIDGCKAAGAPTSDAFRQCLGNALKDVLPPPPVDSGKLADAFATGVCKALGGDLDQCKAKVAGAAAYAVAACLAAGNPASDAFRKCTLDAIHDLIEANGGPAAASPKQLADSVATGSCAAIQKAKPDLFAAQFGSQDACVAALTPVAAKAVTTCAGKVGSDTWVSCVKAAIVAAVSKQ